jgi:hypothetical protein
LMLITCFFFFFFVFISFLLLLLSLFVFKHWNLILMFDIAEPTKITRAGKEGLTDAEEVKLTNIVADLYHLTTWH